MKHINSRALVLLSFLPISSSAAFKPAKSVQIDPVVLIFFEKAYVRSLSDRTNQIGNSENSVKELQLFFEEAYWVSSLSKKN